ncbi:MAG TPA: sugar transporter, partial [Paenibacillus sp.]|nr:sugar transporter [Paenibacillus sp.]
SEAVAEPSVALFRLDEPAPTLDGDRSFERFVLMLAPKRLPKRELELLSEISAMLLQQHFIETLESDDASRIVQYMSNQLEAYIKNHIEWSV